MSEYVDNRDIADMTISQIRIILKNDVIKHAMTRSACVEHRINLHGKTFHLLCFTLV